MNSSFNLSLQSFDRLIVPTFLATLAAVLLLILLVLASKRQKLDIAKRGWISRTIYFAFLVCIGFLSISSFGSILRTGHMQGYALMAHTTFAGAFVFLLLGFALMYLPRGVASRNHWFVERWSAWGLVLTSLVTAATMLVSMLPLLDTQGLLQATQVHRYAGLATAVFALFHGLATLVGCRGWR